MTTVDQAAMRPAARPPLGARAKRLAAQRLRAGDIGAILTLEAKLRAAVPLIAGLAACDFPSPADDYLAGRWISTSC